MQLYSGKVRLNGNVYHEVRKDGMSAAEVVLLQHIHGNDSVVDIAKDGETERRDPVERTRLMEIYGDDKVREVFGLSSLPLPQVLTGLDEDDDAEPVRRRPRRLAEPTPDPLS